MAASRSMLESLLARVRQRAAEPRGGQPQSSTRKSQPGAEQAVATAPPPAPLPSVRAQPMSAEEEIEEYDDDLIEIIDDNEISTDDSTPPPPSVPPSAPLELRASAPSVEMRRRAVPPSATPQVVPAPAQAAPSPVAAAPRVAAAAPPAPVAAAPAPAAAPTAPLRAEVVGRRPLPAAAVVQAQAARPDARTASFIELLDASLDLGD